MFAWLFFMRESCVLLSYIESCMLGCYHTMSHACWAVLASLQLTMAAHVLL